MPLTVELDRSSPVPLYYQLAQAIEAAGIVHPAQPTPRQVSDTVIAIRRRKLPDPAQVGNAGSFFKNPVVPGEQCRALLERFPALVHHAQLDGSEKLAAGWLIDQCGWKGRNLGAAGVYPKQALVLVNNGGATGAEVVGADLSPVLVETARRQAAERNVKVTFEVGDAEALPYGAATSTS